MKTLAHFVSRNLGGRALFLSVPVAAGAVAHAATLALSKEPFIAVFAGCLAALAAMGVASWLWLDADAAVALERKYEHGSMIAAFLSLPLVFISPTLMGAMMAAALASFGANCGIVRISAYEEASDPPPPVSHLAMLAWLCQIVGLASCLASTTLIGDAVAVAVGMTAVVAASLLPRETLTIAVE